MMNLVGTAGAAAHSCRSSSSSSYFRPPPSTSITVVTFKSQESWVQRRTQMLDGFNEVKALQSPTNFEKIEGEYI